MIQLDSITWHQDSIRDVSVVVWYQAINRGDFWMPGLERRHTLWRSGGRNWHNHSTLATQWAYIRQVDTGHIRAPGAAEAVFFRSLFEDIKKYDSIFID